MTFTGKFDEHVLKLLFRSRVLTKNGRLLNGTTWIIAPKTLRERYLYHLFESSRVNASVFGHLASPVFEQTLDRLGITGPDKEKEMYVRRWCALPMHELWGLSWVVAHKVSTFDAHKARSERHYQLLSGPWTCLSETNKEASKRRVEHNVTFLQIALDIINDNQDVALKLLFPASFVCPDELN